MSLGVEWGCVYRLEGPDGTVAVFNDSTDPNFVGMLNVESSGLDSPEVREDAQEVTEGDGGVHGSFWYGRRPVVLQGTILASNAADRNAKVARLLRASNAMRGDAILKWKPNGAPVEVSLSLRRNQPVRITKGFVKDFFVPMVSAKAEIESAVSKSAAVWQSTGYKSPSEASNAGTGSKAWTSPTAIFTSNNSYASIAGPGAYTSQRIYARKFNFGVPTSAIPLEIWFEFERKASLGESVQDSLVQLSNSIGALFGGSVGALKTWTLTEEYAKYGGALSIFGLNKAELPAAVINSGTFGVNLQIASLGGDASLDHVRGKIVFTQSEALINEGDATAYPVIKVTGPATNIVLENKTTGEKIELTAIGLASGEVAVIDFRNRTIVKNGANAYAALNFTTSVWWGLAPGANDVSASFSGGIGPDDNTKVEIEYKDAWI